MTFEEIEKKVVKWGKDRSIFEGSDDLSQCSKLCEELSELYEAVRTKSRPDEIIDGIGDMLVVLTMIAKFNGLTLTKCFDYAYNQIKDRRGKMINGLFVKES